MMLEVAGRPAYAYTGGKPFDPQRPTVVFVHGAQHDHSVWILQTRYLAHPALSSRGHENFYHRKSHDTSARYH